MESERDDIKILNCVFCDDVRTEQNGKEILIGVYTGDFGVPKLPWRVSSLSVWMQLELPPKPEKTNVAIRLLNTFGTRIAELSFSATPVGRLGVLQRSPVGFAFQTGSFEIQKVGELLLEMRNSEGAWVKGRSLLVAVHPETPQAADG
ncbi:MAG: hypothetical protein U1E52_08460 [Geminicoccaceae bacterium]